MKILLSFLIALVSLDPINPVGKKKPFTPKDLISLDRTSNLKICGHKGIFTRSKYILESNNKFINSLWEISFDSGEMKELLPLKEITTDYVWMDCSNILLLQTAKKNRLIKFNINSLTFTILAEMDFEISNLLYENEMLFFTSEVYFNKTIAETIEIDDQKDNFSSAMVFDKLYFRHWDSFDDHKYSHIFSIKLNVKSSDLNLLEALDLMKSTRFSSPVQPFGDVGDFSVSNQILAFTTMEYFDQTIQANSTNTNIYLVSFNRSLSLTCVTCENMGADSKPQFSLDSRKLAYLEMTTPAYESDKNRLIIYDLFSKTKLDATETLDISVESFLWLDNSSTIIFIAGERGRSNIFKLDLYSMEIMRISSGGVANSLTRISNSKFVFSRNSMNHPDEYFVFDVASGIETQTSFIHASELSSFEMSDVLDFEFLGALNETVHGFFLKPFGFDPKLKYPLAFLIHGGPEDAWMDDWSLRWNPQIYTNAGYAVGIVNFHGSNTYGQNFTKSILRNWGSYPFEDLMKGLDYITQTFDFIDQSKIVGLGASYGGYMINWINGHSDRFIALVNHDGIFDLRSKYYTTEELFFSEFSLGGTPFEHPESYEKFSPHSYVHRWKTPTLVIHGAKDFRLTSEQGFSTFTALQRLGIESKLLFFPDENHWVLGAANSIQWYEVVIEWINKFTR
jgi:dipeptidyl aminopeptidase/acylaminoacyl peptidase